MVDEMNTATKNVVKLLGIGNAIPFRANIGFGRQ